MGKRGPKPGAGGRPTKPLVDKVLEGNPGRRPLKTVKMPDTSAAAEQKLVVPASLGAKGKAVFQATVAWLEKTGCMSLILPAHIEAYALCKERWLECEEKNAQLGLIAKHPTTGQPIQSPFVNMAITYLKQADSAWAQIYAVVKDNCSQEFRQNVPHEDVMEQLLSMNWRGGKRDDKQ